MIRPLRKRHLQIWIALAVLIPLGIIVGWITIPEQVKDRLLQPTSSQTLPFILETFYSRGPYEVNLRASSDTNELQLEWLNKQTLTYPTATIIKCLYTILA
jgi:hypothetical protein